MKYTLILALFILGTELKSQELQMVSLKELSERIDKPSDKLKVINFWASWCKPCIMEMPYFEAINKSDAEVLLITLDHPDDIEKATRIVTKNGITSKVLLLNESDADKFISSINSDWSGAIPATMFVDARGNKYFYEEAFDKTQLDKLVKKFSAYNR